MTDRWFGGGTDLTPYYLFEEDAIHFHSDITKMLAMDLTKNCILYSNTIAMNIL